MDHWKYIVLHIPMAGPTMIVFPPTLSHGDMQRKFSPSQAVSAGFVMFDSTKNEFHCYGKSDSLGLESDPGDAELANRLLGRE